MHITSMKIPKLEIQHLFLKDDNFHVFHVKHPEFTLCGPQENMGRGEACMHKVGM